MFPANFKKDFDSDNAIMNVVLALLAVWIGYTAVMQHHRAQERRRRYAKRKSSSGLSIAVGSPCRVGLYRKAEHEEMQRSFLERLSRPVRKPLVERGITADQSKGRQHRSRTQNSSRRGTDQQSRDARRRQRQREENERQLLLSIRRRETKGFTPLRDTPDDLQHQSPNPGPSSNVVNPRNQVRHSGDSQVAATQDNSTKAPAPVNNGTQVAPKQASKKRARDELNDDQNAEEDSSASRGFKRPCKGHEIVAAIITLPGGYEHIHVDMLKPDRPKAQRRRKRDDLDSDYDDYDTEDPDALRRLSRARFIRRRVEKIKHQIENDPEILIVERFVQIAAKYAKFERFGELSTGHDDDDLLGSAHISEIESEDSETTDSETASTGSYHTGRDTTSDASADPATTSREKSKMSAQGSRKKGIHTSALLTDAKAKIVAKVVAAADKRFNTVSLTPRRVPSALAGESWTEANGTTWRISAKDGQKRQLVAVENWRRKYHMVRIYLVPWVRTPLIYR